jgi:hypothetical protein
MLALLVPDTGTFELMHITFIINLTSASLLYRLVNTNPGKTMQPMLLVAQRTRDGTAHGESATAFVSSMLVAWIAQHASLLRLYFDASLALRP